MEDYTAVKYAMKLLFADMKAFLGLVVYISVFAIKLLNNLCQQSALIPLQLKGMFLCVQKGQHEMGIEHLDLCSSQLYIQRNL